MDGSHAPEEDKPITITSKESVMYSEMVLSLINDDLKATRHKMHVYTSSSMDTLGFSIRKGNEICCEWHGTNVPKASANAILQIAAQAFIAGMRENPKPVISMDRDPRG